MTNPLLQTDVYKLSHMHLYPAGTEYVYETLTPRKNSFFPWSNKMTVFGYQLFVSRLKDNFDKNFFQVPEDEMVAETINAVTDVLSEEYAYKIIDQFIALHKLGYLPLKIQALPEGSLVPMQVPVLTIENTLPEFFWLPGYLETILLSETFVTSTVASMARQFHQVADLYADISADSKDFLPFQMHDFSQRGQHGNDAAVLSGVAHLTSFAGTDVIQAPAEIRKHFKTEPTELIGASVLATEHSVMESISASVDADITTDSFNNQLESYRQLIANNPSGILSIVSDTYDYWEVVNQVLPALKDEIMARDGKVVIRPDSDTELVELTNDSVVLTKSGWQQFITTQTMNIITLPTGRVITKDGLADFKPGDHDDEISDMDATSELLLATLYSMADTFGYTVNSKGFKVIDSHIGLLHGEGVTLDNVQNVFEALLGSEFSSENIVLGVGAYVYSVLVSRDSFGQALKATSVTINGQEKAVFKNPKTASEKFKKSRRGRVQIIKNDHDEYEVHDGFDAKTIQTVPNELTTIFENGSLQKTSFQEIRNRINENLHVDAPKF